MISPVEVLLTIDKDALDTIFKAAADLAFMENIEPTIDQLLHHLQAREGFCPLCGQQVDRYFGIHKPLVPWPADEEIVCQEGRFIHIKRGANEKDVLMRMTRHPDWNVETSCFYSRPEA